ncbi:hypothetical protein [Sphingomonas ginsenosidivorax]|nr:hypothetical protein [Sphingomonas ginsenosidivorax]
MDRDRGRGVVQRDIDVATDRLRDSRAGATSAREAVDEEPGREKA